MSLNSILNEEVLQHKTFELIFYLFSYDTLQVLMFVCPIVLELRFYGCFHPCFYRYTVIKNKKRYANNVHGKEEKVKVPLFFFSVPKVQSTNLTLVGQWDNFQTYVPSFPEVAGQSVSKNQLLTSCTSFLRGFLSHFSSHIPHFYDVT